MGKISNFINNVKQTISRNRRNGDKAKDGIPTRKDNLKYILNDIGNIANVDDDTKVLNTKHYALIDVIMELMPALPLEEQKIIRKIIEACRYD